MPLLKRKPVPLLADPPGLAELPSDAEVFLLSQTGEIFLSYQDYSTRYTYLRSRIFQCEFSGKTNLDYFSALESERTEARIVRERFPEEMKGRVLGAVQFQVVGRLDHLVEAVYERFKDRYFPGEKVFVDLSGDKYYARISQVFPPSTIRALADRMSPQPFESTSTLPPSRDYTQWAHRRGIDLSLEDDQVRDDDNPSEYLYTVQLMDEELKFEGSFMEVKAGLLSRDRLAFSKSILKRYLRESLTREPLIASPWIVKPALAAAYNLPGLSEEERERTQRIREGKLAQRKRGAETMDDGVGAFAKGNSGAGGAKKKRGMADEPEWIMGEDGVPVAVPRAAPAPTALPAKLPPKPADAKKPPKYPIEDLELDPRTIHDGRVLRRVNALIPPLPPKPALKRGDLVPGVPRARWEDFLQTWLALNVFSKPLGLEPFAIDDFANALGHEYLEPRCYLLAEIHASLTNLIAADSTARIYATDGVGLPMVPDTPQLGAEEVDEGPSSPAAEKREGSAEPASSSTSPGPPAEVVPLTEEEELEELIGTALAYAKRWDRSAKLKNADGREGWERHTVGALMTRGGLIPPWTNPTISVLKGLFGPEESIRKKEPPKEEDEDEMNEDDKGEGTSGAANGSEATPEEPVEPPVKRKPGRPKKGTGPAPPKPRAKSKRAGAGTRASRDVVPEVPGPLTPEARYLLLSFEDKLDVISFLVAIALGHKSLRAFMDESELSVTEFRKERAEVNKERKRLLEEKTKMGHPTTNGEEGNGDLGVPAATMSRAPSMESMAFGAGQNDHLTDDGHLASELGDDIDELDSEAGETASARADVNADEEASARSHSPSAASAAVPPLGLSSRQVSLKLKQEEKEALQAAKLAENQDARTSASKKKVDKATTRIDDELAKNTKRDDLVEREFRRHLGVSRVKPLGKDRFHNRYWWFDGVGGMNLVSGPTSQIAYFTGRLYVQGPSADDWGAACEENGGEEEMKKRRKVEEIEQAAILDIDEWAFYEDEEEINSLLGWLNSKGVRELALKNSILKWKNYIVGGSKRRKADQAVAFRPLDARRSVRARAIEADLQRSYLSYVNKQARY